jgi:hypothetical protein
MKFLVTAVALVFGLVSSAANAAEGTAREQVVKLSAQVEPSCSFTGVRYEGSGFEASNAGNTSNLEVPISGMRTLPASGQLDFENFTCNARLRLSITGGGKLTNKVQSLNSPEFETSIPYMAYINTGSDDDILLSFTNDVSQDIFLNPASTVPVSLKINIVNEEVNLAAGSYDDTLTLYFYPQI